MNDCDCDCDYECVVVVMPVFDLWMMPAGKGRVRVVRFAEVN